MFLTAVMIVLSGCLEKEDANKLIDEISVSVDTLNFGPEGGKLDVEVTSSADWRVSGVSDWVAPAVTSGKSGMVVSFNAEPNDGDSVKETVFKFFTGSAVKKVVVTSTPSLRFELASDSEMFFAPEGGSGYVRLLTSIDDCDYEFSGDGASWIEMGSQTDVFGYKTRLFNVKETKLYTDRESVLTIKSVSGSVSVKFVQYQRDTVGIDNPLLVYDLQARDIEFKIRANVGLDYDLPDWMSLISATDGEVGEDGLETRTFRIHLDESVASRNYTLIFANNAKEMLRVTIKQKNPNPVLANISDSELRRFLADIGWILAEDSSTECEVLEPGLCGKSLSIASDGYTKLAVDEISGLGAFPKLEDLTVSNSGVRLLNVSDCKSLTKVTLSENQDIKDVITGDSPVSEIDIPAGSYSCITSSSLTLSGNNIKTIKVESNSSMISYWEKLASLDVTGCPMLTDLKAKREYSGWGSPSCKLEKIYVTAAQKAAIDAGTLTVEKSDLTSIEVK